jgi:hypothetical protein
VLESLQKRGAAIDAEQAEDAPDGKTNCRKGFFDSIDPSSNRMSPHRTWGMPSSRLRAQTLAVIERELRAHGKQNRFKDASTILVGYTF